MKRFRFPLKPVGILRAHQEARARASFATAVHAYVEAEATLARTRARVAELEEILFEGRRERFSPAEQTSFFHHYHREANAIVEAEKKVFAAADAMRLAREKYLEATRAVKVIARLEEKARETHRRETERALQAELDEFAALRRLSRLVA